MAEPSEDPREAFINSDIIDIEDSDDVLVITAHLIPLTEGKFTRCEMASYYQGVPIPLLGAEGISYEHIFTVVMN